MSTLADARQSKWDYANLVANLNLRHLSPIVILRAEEYS